jgi:hypothetical protein
MLVFRSIIQTPPGSRKLGKAAHARCKAPSKRYKRGNIEMLTYAGILLASLTAALLVGQLFKAAVAKSRSANLSTKRVIVPDNSTSYKKARAGYKTCNGVTVPSKQQSRMVAMSLDKSSPAQPVVCRNPDASWLVRENKLLSMQRSYKVKRRVEPQPLTLEKASKPFRREVASWAQNNKLAVRPWKA